MSLKDRILALCHQYATGGRVGYDDGGSITDPAGEIARELAAGSVPRNYKRVRANEALAGRELTPYLESRVADYLAREDEIKARRLEAFDAPGTAKSLAGLIFPDPSTMVVPREGAESAGPDIRRRQQDQLMRGIPLSPEQEAERAAYLDALDSRRAIRANELDEGASATGTLGAAAPFAMPGVGRSAVKGMDYVGSQIAKMPGYMQKAAPAVGGLGILGGMTAEAGGDDPRIKEIAAKEREVERIRAEIAKASKDWYPTTSTPKCAKTHCGRRRKRRKRPTKKRLTPKQNVRLLSTKAATIAIRFCARPTNRFPKNSQHWRPTCRLRRWQQACLQAA
jgi:hypothetical protein